MNRASFSFKQDYVRILTHGPKDESDYPLAVELIGNEYATGTFSVSKRRGSYGRVDRLMWGGATTKGRLFADELQNQLHQSSIKSRLGKAALAAGGFFAGAAVQFIAAWLGRA